MTKRTWFIIAVTITIWICLFPFVVLGEGSTYVVIPQNECIDHAYNANYYWKFSGSGELRATIASIGSGRENTVIVSKMPFTYSRISSGADKLSACIAATPSTNANYYNQNGYSFYYYGVYTNGINPLNIPSFHFDSGEVHEKAYDLTFGELAEEPEEPINWGLLKNLSFSQRTRGTGYINYRHNLDYIRWDIEQDSNGNPLTDCQVEIRAHTGFWSASTYDEFLGMDKRDLIRLKDTFVDLGTYSASVGEVAISWERILNDIAKQGLTVNGKKLDAAGIIPVEEIAIGEFWTKFGWWYEVRLVPPDTQPMRWQEVYTPMGTSVKDSNTIVNNNNVTNEVLNVYETITQLNNQTQITVIYNNNTVTVVNPDSEPKYDSSDDLYSDVLRKILTAILNLPSVISDGVTTIIENIVELPEILWEKVQELVTPPQEYDETLTNQYNQEVNDYLEYHQPTIFEILDEMDNIQEQITSYAPEDQGAHQCILYWEDVSLDLTPFGAGNVVFLQAGQHNLTETFLSLLHAFDLTYADYETLVSAIIYLWLLVFIWRHFIKFLEKD